MRPPPRTDVRVIKVGTLGCCVSAANVDIFAVEHRYVTTAWWRNACHLKSEGNVVPCCSCHGAIQPTTDMYLRIIT